MFGATATDIPDNSYDRASPLLSPIPVKNGLSEPVISIRESPPDTVPPPEPSLILLTYSLRLLFQVASVLLTSIRHFPRLPVFTISRVVAAVSVKVAIRLLPGPVARCDELTVLITPPDAVKSVASALADRINKTIINPKMALKMPFLWVKSGEHRHLPPWP